MRIAALTYVYNESVNLRIWLNYYGKNFGEKNLYILDRESDDGSTSDLGDVNRILIPRIEFDDIQKSAAISSMHNVLLQRFDCVVVTDCDEIVVADPEKYADLNQYITANKPTVVNCIGLNLRHIITLEPPLNLERPILSQRKFASFGKPSSKPLISSVPTVWQAGNHICSEVPKFDHDLFVFHLKYMDYGLGMMRQSTNRETTWSNRAIEANHGIHHRYEYDQFVSEGYLDPVNAIRAGKVAPFEFAREIEALSSGSKLTNGLYRLGDAPPKYVEIPERFSAII